MLTMPAQWLCNCDTYSEADFQNACTPRVTELNPSGPSKLFPHPRCGKAALGGTHIHSIACSIGLINGNCRYPATDWRGEWDAYRTFWLLNGGQASGTLKRL